MNMNSKRKKNMAHTWARQAFMLLFKFVALIHELCNKFVYFHQISKSRWIK